MMIKKIFVTILSFSMILTLASCGKETTIEYGDIKETEISEYNVEKQEDLFKEITGVFDYKEWKTFTLGMMSSSISLPSSWEVRIINGRNYQISIPKSDPYLPNSSLVMIFDYTGYNTNAETPQKYDQIFQRETKELFYLIDGRQYCEADIDINPTEMYTEDIFTNKQELISASIYNNPAILEELGLGNDVDGYYSVIHYNVYFEGFPVQFRWCFPSSELETAKKMASQIASTLKVISTCTEKKKTVDLGGINIDVPESFIEEEGVYRGSTRINSMYSGIMIGKFDVKLDVPNYGQDADFIEIYLKQMAEKYMPGYDVVLPAMLVEGIDITMNGQKGLFVEASLFFSALEGYNKKGSFYGEKTNIEVLLYVLPSPNEEHEVVALFVLPSQEDATFDMISSINKALDATA